MANTFSFTLNPNNLTVFDMNDFTDSQFNDRRASGAGLGVKIDMLHSDVVDMKEAIKSLAASINRLAVVEERLGNTAVALERAFASLAKIEGKLVSTDSRVSELEKQGVTTKQTNTWAEKVLWAVAAAALLFIGKKVGLV